MEKYYTPEYYELHSGFECEHLVHGGEWRKTEIDDLDEVNYLGEKRVKYLDREDIEELGWENLGSAWYNLKEVPGKLGHWLYVRMRFVGEECFIKAYRYDPKENKSNEEQFLFDGKVKNKSELKKLMSQLNVK